MHASTMVHHVKGITIEQVKTSHGYYTCDILITGKDGVQLELTCFGNGNSAVIVEIKDERFDTYRHFKQVEKKDE